MTPRLSFLSIVLLNLPWVASAASSLPRSTPEEQGVSSARLLEFVQSADQTVNSMHSFMLLRHGKVISEGWWTPYNPETRHELYSLSKSFTSTAVGMAVSEGKLSVDDEVLKFFPGDAPENPSENLKAMRVRDLLRMSTGHQTEPSVRGSSNWVKAFLAHAVSNKPGTHFLYNTPATYMQSAIVQKVTGSTVLDYLQPRLFQPLGIEAPTWGTSPQGVSLGGYGLNVRTEDIAKFGQLYLQHGKWNGKQLLPAAWVTEATALQTSNGSKPTSDWDQGYGYQFWRCRHGIYRGDGAFGQYCIVMPDQDAVLAITSGTKDMQHVLNLVWDKLLPAFQTGSIAPNNESYRRLKDSTSKLTIPPQLGSALSSNSDLIGKKFVFAPNDQKLESLKVEAEGSTGTAMVLTSDGQELRLVCQPGKWNNTRGVYGTAREQSIAASGAWSSEEVFALKLSMYETPFLINATVRFSGSELSFATEQNVGFGAARRPVLTARAQ